jgi:hypothetical protein
MGVAKKAKRDAKAVKRKGKKDAAKQAQGQEGQNGREALSHSSGNRDTSLARKVAPS